MRKLLIGLMLVCGAGPAMAAAFAVSKTADSNDGTCNADCSLREAVRAANAQPGSDTILLPPGSYVLTIAGADDVAAAGDLDITGSMTLSGGGIGQTTITTAVPGRVLHIDPSMTRVPVVVLRDLAVTGGVDDFGGGILNRSTLSLQNVALRDNRAVNGGGLWSVGGLQLAGVDLRDNQAVTTGSLTTGFGGGMFVTGTTLGLVDCAVAENSSSRNGAGIYASSVAVSADALTTFAGNVAAGSGGAIESVGTAGSAGSVTTQATFTANVANDGGAISNQRYSTLTCTACTFASNRADGQDLGGGGAIFNYEGSTNITASTFSANVASGPEGGGAIENGGIAAGGMLTIEGSTFSGNQAPNPAPDAGQGGALLLIAGSTTTVGNTSFSNNLAGSSGGAIYLDQNAALFLTDVGISGNTAQRQFGGGIVSEGNATLLRTTVTANQAGGFAGGISSRVGTLAVHDSEIHGNSAPEVGGIGNFGSPLVIRRSTIANNQATRAAGGIAGGLLFDGGSGTLENTTISGNSAAIGGAIANNAAGNGDLTLVNVTLTGNVATQGGGGGAIGQLSSGKVALRNSAVSGNCNFPQLSLGGNVESPGNTCGFSQASDARSIASLMLAALGSNGGPTRTHNPLAGSPLVDHVQVGQCLAVGGGALAVDQRGFPRPYDGNADGSARCDAGSVERQPQVTIFADGFE